MQILGLDIGGSGIKGAMVDPVQGALLSPRYRLPTPQPATPEAVVAVAAQIAAHFQAEGPIGCGFPAPIKHGMVLTAANISEQWIGVNGEEELSRALGAPVCLLNDADAAGLAEVRFGVGRERRGLVVMLTIGTGIGSALFLDGQLIPNSEFGHLEIRGKGGEKRASDAVRRKKRLSWAAWARRFDEYLQRLNGLLWPDLIIIGGGASKYHHHFLPLLTVKTELLVAQLRNEAGIIGAALAAAERADLPSTLGAAAA